MTDALHKTRKGMAAVGQSAAETAREVVEGTGENLREAAVHGRERMISYYRDASRAARRWRRKGAKQYEKMRSGVQRHAIISTVVAFGTGLLVARFLFRR